MKLDVGQWAAHSISETFSDKCDCTGSPYLPASSPQAFSSSGVQDGTKRGSKNIPAAYKPNGTFVSMKNATLNDRLGVSLSATEVSTVW